MKDFDRANSHFFEAMQIGPARYFTSLEMMTLISRNLEQMTMTGDEDTENAYRMVHSHLVREGLISEKFDYDDWICDAKTWMSLGTSPLPSSNLCITLV